MRLGTVWPDLDGLITVLRRGSGALRDALDQVRGCAEWELRVERMEGRAVQDGLDAATGTQYLLDRRAERRRVALAHRPLTAELDAVDGGLVARARAVVSRDFPGGGLVRAYLVPADRTDDFVHEADRVAAQLAGVDCAAALRGPLAAYSFVDLRLEARP
jgi:gas vesicle protein GvpL/GvpF